MHRKLVVLFVLAVTQITGWGAVGVLPVIATPVAATYGTSLPSVFLGRSIMFIALALTAPWAGSAFRRFGARQVMTAGAGLIALGLAILAAAPTLFVFWLAWALIGAAGALFLTTAAYAYIAEYAPDGARSLIGTLMLVTGLAGSVFWPITAFLDHLTSWRGALIVYAGIMALLVCPLLWFGLPEARATTAATVSRGSSHKGRVFALLVCAIALNSFVTFGIEALGIELLQALGATLPVSIAIASALGVFKVGGRVIDLLGGKRWDGLSTALVSGAMIPLGLAVIALGHAGFLSVAGYLLLFGIGSGAFAVARATLPLLFYSKADYAAAMSTISLPMNLINALAPPALATLLVSVGPRAVLAVLAGLSIASFALLLQLKRSRPTSTAGGS